ncbi:VOC family protein [Aquincola sp. S2]|uniref:VOC family protein n=1 Tax=Pseudaquabacterium terrae TaxID=2732868 RepID=A0ABX2EI37_9BURK|nr:VOC family protein [Aquabacterium terrae]NRF68279.1 VOC family protein [Aquabacterium terrae]
MTKTKKVPAIPPGYSSITPYLTIKGAAEAIDFYKKAFNAEEVMRMNMPDGLVGHAEIRIGGSVIMLHDENPQWKALSPKTIGDSASAIMLYVPDCDTVFQRAVANGATVTMPVEDQFYGDRCGNVTDPFGHKWCIATHIEDVEPDEIARRAKKKFAEMAKS